MSKERYLVMRSFPHSFQLSDSRFGQVNVRDLPGTNSEKISNTSYLSGDVAVRDASSSILRFYFWKVPAMFCSILKISRIASTVLLSQSKL